MTGREPDGTVPRFAQEAALKRLIAFVCLAALTAPGLPVTAEERVDLDMFRGELAGEIVAGFSPAFLRSFVGGSLEIWITGLDF